MTKYTYDQLVAKITLAEAHLRRARAGRHSNFCPIEDPESYAPCNCGASANDEPINAALRELKL